MVVGVIQVDLSIPAADSLKGKRMVLRSLKDRIRNNFNVSVAEIADNDQWTSATIGIATICNDGRFANQVLSKVVDFIEKSRDVIVDDYSLTIL